MTPERLIELGKRIEDLLKLQDLLKYRNDHHHDRLEALVLTVKTSKVSKSITIKNGNDITRIFDLIEDITVEIERVLETVKEVD